MRIRIAKSNAKRTQGKPCLTPLSIDTSFIVIGSP